MRTTCSGTLVAILALSGALTCPSAFAQAQPASALGVSLQRYCAAQLGHSDLSEAELALCQQRLQAELDEFAALDQGEAPQARGIDAGRTRETFVDPDDEFQLDEPAGRTRPAAKKGSQPAGDEFAAEEDEEPQEDEEFGFNFEFEGQQEPEDPVEDFDFDPIDDPDAEPLGDLETTKIPEAKDPPRAAPPTGAAAPTTSAAIQLEVVGKIPLADNYAPQIVAWDRDSVVVELPVLLGRSRADFDGIAYCVVAEIFSDGRKVAESRLQVTSASLAEFGPSFAFVKMLTPVTAKTGQLELRVSKASTMAGQGTQLFSRKLPYQLP